MGRIKIVFMGIVMLMFMSGCAKTLVMPAEMIQDRQACITEVQKTELKKAEKSTPTGPQISQFKDERNYVMAMAIEKLGEANKKAKESPFAHCDDAMIAWLKANGAIALSNNETVRKGFTVSGAVGGAWIIKDGVVETVGAIAGAGANNITVGEIHQTKSDDPILGEGGGRVDSGDQTINFTGNVASGQGMNAIDVDKAQHTNFKDAESNLDGSGNPSGVQQTDNDDIRNDVGLVN
jgi:hypothetical protein